MINRKLIYWIHAILKANFINATEQTDWQLPIMIYDDYAPNAQYIS